MEPAVCFVIFLPSFFFFFFFFFCSVEMQRVERDDL
jgi:hypothetical protein